MVCFLCKCWYGSWWCDDWVVLVGSRGIGLWIICGIDSLECVGEYVVLVWLIVVIVVEWFKRFGGFRVIRNWYGSIWGIKMKDYSMLWIVSCVKDIL